MILHSFPVDGKDVFFPVLSCSECLLSLLVLKRPGTTLLPPFQNGGQTWKTCYEQHCVFVVRYAGEIPTIYQILSWDHQSCTKNGKLPSRNNTSITLIIDLNARSYWNRVRNAKFLFVWAATLMTRSPFKYNATRLIKLTLWFQREICMNSTDRCITSHFIFYPSTLFPRRWSEVSLKSKFMAIKKKINESADTLYPPEISRFWSPLMKKPVISSKIPQKYSKDETMLLRNDFCLPYRGWG